MPRSQVPGADNRKPFYEAFIERVDEENDEILKGISDYLDGLLTFVRHGPYSHL